MSKYLLLFVILFTTVSNERAAKVVYRALQTYLQPNSTYMDAANATRQSAIDLFGSCSDVAQQVVFAWARVGITLSNTCSIDCNAITFAPAANPSIAAPGQIASLSANGSNDFRYLVGTQWTLALDNTVLGRDLTLSIAAPNTPGNYIYFTELAKWDVLIHGWCLCR